MTREFVILPEFQRKWEKCGFDDADLSELQYQLCLNPKVGNMMDGTGGLRKVRFALRGRGKSGSVRVVYVDFGSYKKIYLVTAFTKSEKTNLSQAERNEIKAMIQLLKNELRRR